MDREDVGASHGDLFGGDGALLGGQEHDCLCDPAEKDSGGYGR